MKIITTASDKINTDLFNKIEKFVVRQYDEDPSAPAIKNMLWDKGVGLLWNIQEKIRWCSEHGSISVLLNEEEVIGISCVEYSVYKKLGIGGIRCWVDKKFRGQNVESGYLLSSNLNWCRDSNLSGMILTFNDYNKWIYDSIKRKSEGLAAGVATAWTSWWNDCLIIEQPLEIRYTYQWCVIKPIDIDFCRESISKLS